MAKHNVVRLYGRVMDEPRIIKNENGEYVRGMFHITVIRGKRDNGDGIENIHYENPLIMSGYPDKIKTMDKLKINDMVEIKGSLTTKNINKSTICKQCGQKNILSGELIFVSPIFLGICETNRTEEEAMNLLKKKCEISNEVTLVGNLCNDVNFFSSDKLKVGTYQLAIDRKYYLKDDAPAIRTDYPHIRVFGEQAKQDSLSLHKSSRVLIDGLLQSREYERKTICANEECTCEYTWNDSTLEVIPYSVEYLQNYLTTEEIEAKKAEEEKEAKNSVFGEE